MGRIGLGQLATCCDSFEKSGALNRSDPGTAADSLFPVPPGRRCTRRISRGAMQGGFRLRENHWRGGWFLERPRACLARKPYSAKTEASCAAP